MFRFIKDENSQLMRMTAGDLDFLILTPEAFIQKTNKLPWGTSIIKKEIKNKRASGYSYIGWNLKNPLFQGKKTRKSFSSFNEQTINK